MPFFSISNWVAGYLRENAIVVDLGKTAHVAGAPAPAPPSAPAPPQAQVLERQIIYLEVLRTQQDISCIDMKALQGAALNQASQAVGAQVPYFPPMGYRQVAFSAKTGFRKR